MIRSSSAQMVADKRHIRVRKATKAGVKTIVRITSDKCQFCFDPLDPTATWPDPMATTVGHEPPLCRVRELGVTEVVERPEHWKCNMLKGILTDDELRAKLRMKETA